MNGAAVSRTAGERLVHRYFKEHGIPVADHPEIDGAKKRPDVVIGDGSRRVICEIADFGVGEPDKPVLAALEASRTAYGSGITIATAVGSLPIPEILQRIRGKIVTELAQLGEFRGQYPLVVMLHNDGSLSTDLELHVQWAFCGLLTSSLNRHLSAVGVVTSVRRGSDVEQRVLRGLRKDEGKHRRSRQFPPSREDLARGFDVLMKEKRDWGGALDEEHPALCVYHNCYAERRVPPSVFPAPFASHARLVPHRGQERDPVTGVARPIIYFTLHEMRVPQRHAT